MSNAYFQAAMSEYLAEEARAADMAPLHEQMFGHALEPDGVETDYPGGPLVVERAVVLDTDTGREFVVEKSEEIEGPEIVIELDGEVWLSEEATKELIAAGLKDLSSQYAPCKPAVVEKSGADEAVRAAIRDDMKRDEESRAAWLQVLVDVGSYMNFPGGLKRKPAPDLSAITRDIARGG